MYRIIGDLGFCGLFIGIAGLAGNIEQCLSPTPAIVIIAVSSLLLYIGEKADRKRRGKRYGKKH